MKQLICAVLIAATSGFAVAKDTMVYSANITEAEILTAQRAWGDALVAISTTYKQKGRRAAAVLAGTVLDEAYGYSYGPVLFKPTLAEAPQTFRTTRAGALSYFVGGDKNFPNDTGFALKGWTKVEIVNSALHIDGDVGSSMGNVMFTNADGTVTTVDKTWTFKKTDDGKVRVVVHHSSLPYSD